MTSTVPTAPEGAVAVILVLELTTKLLAAAAPKLTPLAKVKPVPVTITCVPPPELPLSGATPATVGTGMHRFSKSVGWASCAAVT